jgi:hypothetical protein
LPSSMLGITKSLVCWTGDVNLYIWQCLLKPSWLKFNDFVFIHPLGFR